MCWSLQAYCFSFNGRPVWPLRTSTDRANVAAIAQRAGAELVFVDSSSLERVSLSSAALVVGIGCDRDLVRLLGHLTQRAVVFIDEVIELGQLKNVELIVSSFQDTDARLWTAIASLGLSSFQAGIISESDPEILRQRILCTAATIAFPPIASGRVAEVNGVDSRCYSVDSGKLNVTSEPAAIRELLTSRLEVAIFVTHSDGVDARITSNLTLCGVIGRNLTVEGESPHCTRTGECFRHFRDLGDPSLHDLVVTADDIDAALVVLIACYGAMSSYGHVHPSWSLLRRFQSNLKVDAIVTVFGTTNLASHELKCFFSELERMETVGAAVTAQNRHFASTGGHDPLLVYGNPHLKVSRAAHRELKKLPCGLADRGIQKSAPDIFRESHFLSTVLTRITLQGEEESQKEAIFAKTALDVYDYCLQHQERLGSSDASILAFHERFAALFTKVGASFANWWLPMVDLRDYRDGKATCPCCGQMANVWRYSFLSPLLPDRQLVRCPNCGPLFDGPRALPFNGPILSHRSGDAFIVLKGVPAGVTFSLLVLETPSPASRLVRQLQLDDGKAEFELSLPEELPPGPIRAAVVMLRKTSLFISYTPLR